MSACHARHAVVAAGALVPAAALDPSSPDGTDRLLLRWPGARSARRRERASGSKSVQRIAGARASALWAANLLFDLAHFSVGGAGLQSGWGAGVKGLSRCHCQFHNPAASSFPFPFSMHSTLPNQPH